MAKSIMKIKASSYLRQAREFLDSAEESMMAGRYNVAAFIAIQSIINSNDAFTIYVLGFRASMDHRECLKLHSDAASIIKDPSQKESLRLALDMRSHAGYMGETISKKDAEWLLRKAVIFHEWTRSKLL